ncbi:hypothetical protein [Nesterenkonia pannonica]|uniref:hypothetical protein n=1 Tax=Nesterenkonia pannonica TaxID=1548602 RepID=UPI002164A4AF|nr:hypothetical protein [Nesterenkonia pannonica]
MLTSLGRQPKGVREDPERKCLSQVFGRVELAPGDDVTDQLICCLLEIGFETAHHSLRKH